MNKLATCAPLHPEMINRVLTFFGGEAIDEKFPAGTPEMHALLAKAKQNPQIAE